MIFLIHRELAWITCMNLELRRTPACCLASIGCLLGAVLVYCVSWIEAARMEAAGQGWEMAFYFSPMVFLFLDFLLLTGALFGFLGVFAGPGARWRLTSTLSFLLCLIVFAAVPWR